LFDLEDFIVHYLNPKNKLDTAAIEKFKEIGKECERLVGAIDDEMKSEEDYDEEGI